MGGLPTRFKADAESMSETVRAELGIRNIDRLRPHDLADHIGIPVIQLGDLATAAPEGDAGRLDHALGVLRSERSSSLSALTVFDGPRRLIIHNEQHSPGRQASDIGHELAHGLLLHDPAPPVDGRGCRTWNGSIEDEANFFAGTLLVPGKAARWAAKRAMDATAVARHFGCSEQMARWRLGVSGADRLARRRSPGTGVAPHRL